MRYDFSGTSYVGIVITAKNSTGGWSEVWVNPDYKTSRSGTGTLSYTASFKAPSEVGTYECRIKGEYWNGEKWITTDTKYFTVFVTPKKGRILEDIAKKFQKKGGDHIIMSVSINGHPYKVILYYDRGENPNEALHNGKINWWIGS